MLSVTRPLHGSSDDRKHVAHRLAKAFTSPPRKTPSESAAATLARWLLEAQREPTGRALWDLFQSDAFAHLWYGARESGEILRSWALERLYTQRPTPGGAHPDPREPAAFSSRAIIGAAAQVLGIRIIQVPCDIDAKTTNAPFQHKLALAWLATYPGGRAPELAVRHTDREDQLYFDMACLLGYVCKERGRFADRESPGGLVNVPQDPAIKTLLHQFAIALLGLPRDCPPEWSCACNQIRARFNAPPVDHDQPTDTLAVADIRRTIERDRG
jgi:hypothetical protein